MEWPKEVILKFIKMYQNKAVIWDARNKDHFNKLIKNDAWNDITCDLSVHTSAEISADECRKKMQTLLASFRREKIKWKKNIGSGIGT